MPSLHHYIHASHLLRRVFLYSFLCLLVGIQSSSVYASGTTHVTRGESITINWDVTGASNCQGSFPGVAYPKNTSETGSPSITSIYDFWISTHSGKSSQTFNNVLAPPNTYAFKCKDNVTGAEDTTTLIVDNCPAPKPVWNGSTLKCEADNVPVANAGGDKTITLPTNSVTQVGSSAGGNPPVTYVWSKVSGPSTYNISAPTSATTNFTGLIAGTYIFRLTVKDNDGDTDTDDVTIKVKPAVATLSADAGADQSITLPTTSSANQTGSASGGTGPYTYTWSQYSKPSGAPVATITATTSATTKFGNMTFVGSYQFKLTVKDSSGSTATDIMTVTVNPAASGSTITVSLFPSSVGVGDASTLTYSTTHADSVNIDCTSGPASAQIAWEGTGLPAGSSKTKTVVSNSSMVGGTDCTATAKGSPGYPDSVAYFTWAVSDGSCWAVSDAGPDREITLPINYYYNQTGKPQCYTRLTWTLISKPAGAIDPIITSPNDSQITSFLNLNTAGVYTFGFTVYNDINHNMMGDRMDVIVHSGPPAPTGSLTANPPSCAIPTGAKTCPVTLTWSTANPIGTSAITTNVPVANTTVFVGNSDSQSTNVHYNNGNPVPYFLYNNGSELASVSVGVDCAAGANKWDTDNDVCANPLVGSVVVTNDYTNNASVDFDCTGSTAWLVKNTDTNTLVASGLGSGSFSKSVPIPNPPWIEGNYAVACSHGSITATGTTLYHYPPPSPSIFIDSYPKTIKAGDTSVINWNIAFSSSSCALVAYPVCTNGVSNCTPDQLAKVAAINNIIATNKTDADDPNGKRPIPSAIVTWVTSDHRALGKKTFSIKQSTDFTIECSPTNKATTRVRVTSSNEQ